MKINDDIRYPHPVLNEDTDDYLKGEFKAVFQYREEGRQLIIGSRISLENDFINSLIQQKKAVSGYYIICRETYLNHLQKAPIGTTEIYFDRTRFFNRIVIRPIVWTKEKIETVSADLFNKEFGTVVRFPKGTVLAVEKQHIMKIEPLRFRPLESIFRLSVNKEMDYGSINIDIDSEKINILISSKTMDNVSSMRETEIGRKMLVNTLFLPVIMEVLAQLRERAVNVEHRLWFMVFSEKCREMGIDLNGTSDSIVEISQKLLKSPLKSTFELMEMWNG